MVTQVMHGTALATEALGRPSSAAPRTVEELEIRGQSRFDTTLRRIWSISFRLGFAGPSRLTQRDSPAVSLREKSLLDAITIGYGG